MSAAPLTRMYIFTTIVAWIPIKEIVFPLYSQDCGTELRIGGSVCKKSAFHAFFSFSKLND